MKSYFKFFMVLLLALPSLAFASSSYLVNTEDIQISVGIPENILPDSTIPVQLYAEYTGASGTSLLIESIDIVSSDGMTHSESLNITLESVGDYILEREQLGQELIDGLVNNTMSENEMKNYIERIEELDGYIRDLRVSRIINISSSRVSSKGNIDLSVDIKYRVVAKTTSIDGISAMSYEDSSVGTFYSSVELTSNSVVTAAPTRAIIVVVDALGWNFVMENIDNLDNIQNYFMDNGFYVENGSNQFPLYHNPKSCLYRHRCHT
jgi:hypothetical protein